MPKSDSVAVGDSETMRRGFFVIVTSPAGVTIVTGNAAEAVLPPAAPDAKTASTAATAPATRTEERST
jgi:hypothetical protein